MVVLKNNSKEVDMKTELRFRNLGKFKIDGAVFDGLIEGASVEKEEFVRIRRTNHDNVSLEGYSLNEVVEVIKEAFVWCKDSDNVLRLIERNVEFILKFNILLLLSELGNQYMINIFLSMGLLTEEEALIILGKYKYDQFLCEEALLCFWGINPGFEGKLLSVLEKENPKVLKIIERFPPKFNPRTVRCFPKRNLNPDNPSEESKKQIFRLRIFLDNLFQREVICPVN